jgi:hypothetical protein
MSADKEQVSIAQSVRTMRENMPALLELAEIQARLARAKFVALSKQGFTDAQALELCKSI